MTKTVILEWDFSPSNYFEEPIEISRQNYMMTIDAGKATATIDYVVFNENPTLREEIQESLNNRFLGVQLFSHLPYELSKSKMIHVDADGGKHIFLEINSVVMLMTAGNLDLQVKDKHGNIISDSKRDRVGKKMNLAELVAKHKPKNPLVVALLHSYHTAVADPNNELVHLYEIRDALCLKFGNENSVRKKLAITKGQWSDFGKLCNKLPLKQARHRGSFTGKLRDATESELAEARKISLAMIEAYLQYLEGLNT